MNIFMRYYWLADGVRAKRTLKVVVGQRVDILEPRGSVRQPVPHTRTAARGRGWAKERDATCERVKPAPCAMESSFHHHGLRHTDAAVKRYVEGRDILDVGAAQGDSMAILHEYTGTTGRVIAYEVQGPAAGTAREVAKARGVRGMVFNMGLRKDPPVGTPKEGEWTTIDVEAARHNLTLGLIKMDIEGAELQVLQGGMETLKRQRPVLTVAIYHNAQLIDVPQWLEANVGGYRLRFHMETFCTGRRLQELRMFAVPPDVAEAEAGAGRVEDPVWG